jgi:hypothetical protein
MPGMMKETAHWIMVNATTSCQNFSNKAVLLAIFKGSH